MRDITSSAIGLLVTDVKIGTLKNVVEPLACVDRMARVLRSARHSRNNGKEEQKEYRIQWREVP